MTATASSVADGQAILAGVIAEPDDDLPRLAYADWLEENGGEAERSRAEFIRAGIAYATSFHGTQRRKDATALLANRCREQQPLPPGWLHNVLFDQPPAHGPCVGWWRGFVKYAHCELPDWLLAGPAIARANPVERVECHGRPLRLVWNPWARTDERVEAFLSVQAAVDLAIRGAGDAGEEVVRAARRLLARGGRAARLDSELFTLHGSTGQNPEERDAILARAGADLSSEALIFWARSQP